MHGFPRWYTILTSMDMLFSKSFRNMIHSHCLIWVNRLSDSHLINYKLSFKVRLFFGITLYPSFTTPTPLRPSLAHFLWPPNTSLRLLEHFLKSHDDFHTSALPLIYYAETGGRQGREPLDNQNTGAKKKNHSQKHRWVWFKKKKRAIFFSPNIYTKTAFNIVEKPPF